MRATQHYQIKFGEISTGTLYSRLPEDTRTFVRKQAFLHRFTQQELRQVCEIALDLAMWQQDGIDRAWPQDDSHTADRGAKKKLLKKLQQHRESLKAAPNRYPAGPQAAGPGPHAEPLLRSKDRLGLGACPVASPRTRCCNLMTLDAVENCGYGCSYCSIQSFFGDQRVYFDPEFARKLTALQIDPQATYHIGTGQSSDSLMWGNSNGVLDALIDFAFQYPNVILELKTKSANIGHLCRRKLPPNLICTWSLNPAPIVDNEEHGTASLEKRVEAARRLAESGCIVGFHFHPMIDYDGWQQGYGDIFHRLQKLFTPAQVAMISLGTLTFIKPVIRKIREQGQHSQVLKLPLVETDGKLSYPDEIKLALFSTAYNSFSSDWQRGVFFYLCMENQRFWRPVFGVDYPSNEAFETAMKQSYRKKIDALRNKPDV